MLPPSVGAGTVGAASLATGVNDGGMTRLVFFGMIFGASLPGATGGAIGAPGAQPTGAALQQDAVSWQQWPR